jgi:hypothetical protein
MARYVTLWACGRQGPFVEAPDAESAQRIAGALTKEPNGRCRLSVIGPLLATVGSLEEASRLIELLNAEPHGAKAH